MAASPLILRMAQAAFERTAANWPSPLEWDQLQPGQQQRWIESQKAAVDTMRGYGKGYAVKALADDDECVEDGQPMLWARPGAISRRHFVEALGVWVSCQPIDVTVDHAAVVFNATPEVIRSAVESDRWMYLHGDAIEMDGL